MLVVTSHDSRPSQEGLYRQFAAVAAAVDLPILLGNVPVRTGIDLTMSTVEQLARIPTVVGIVDGPGDPERPRVTTLAAGRRFVQLCGGDTSEVTFNLAGGRGCISVAANVAPALCSSLQNACRVKDWTRARVMEERLRPLVAALSREADPRPLVAALARQALRFAFEPRLPLMSVTAVAIQAALAGLDGHTAPALNHAARRLDGRDAEAQSPLVSTPVHIQPVAADHLGFGSLRDEAASEGFAFLDRLAAHWISGANRFDGPGECLLGAVSGGELVGVGGLSRDPYAAGDGIGRLRHLYVRPSARRSGAGGALVAALVLRARAHFSRLRLRAGSIEAAAFYRERGFDTLDEDGATHGLVLR